MCLRRKKMLRMVTRMHDPIDITFLDKFHLNICNIKLYILFIIELLCMPVPIDSFNKFVPWGSLIVFRYFVTNNLRERWVRKPTNEDRVTSKERFGQVTDCPAKIYITAQRLEIQQRWHSGGYKSRSWKSYLTDTEIVFCTSACCKIHCCGTVETYNMMRVVLITLEKS